MRKAKEIIPEQQEILLKGLLTQGVICEIFSITITTLKKWRSERGIPYCVIQGDALDTIRFKPRRVAAWARKQNGAAFNDIAAHIIDEFC